MRMPLFRRWAWLPLFWSVWAAPLSNATARNEAPPTLEPPRATVASPAEDAPDQPAAFLQRALELERQRKWMSAIQVYEDALERFPARVELRHRLRLCEAHYRLNRRYQDQSFHQVLLKLPEHQALDLFLEVLERIESNYVETVGLEPLLRRGLDNIEVALRDEVFLGAHAPTVPAECIQGLRAELQHRRQRVRAADTAQARDLVLEVCRTARRSAGIPGTAIILEFAFAACDSLDDYSSYLTPDRLDDLYAMIDGNFVGLGVELKSDPLGLRLVGVLKGGPAHEAGLRVGDRITHIDGESIEGLDLDVAANRLQGPEGSTVSIGLRRPDGSHRELTLVRRPVEVQSVAEARIVEPAAGVGYIQLTGFQKSSTAELIAAVTRLQRQGMRTLVLDLRGNPGGLLNVAVEIADLFLDSGVIVSTRGRAAGQSAVYRATGDRSWTFPLIVLIDGDSASASEILAGALQDHGRARIVGQRSYGKGSVQSIFPLRSAPAGLKLTTAKFYSPRNRAYSEQGVVPEIIVRSAARPGADGNPPAIEPGNPENDPVLRAAIRLAQGR